MGGGFVVAVVLLLGVPGSSSLAVLHLWAPCSFALLVQFSSVVYGNKRRVNVGGGIVSARAVLLGVPGFSPRVVIHLWAPC